jgi:hypothetical protein
MKYTIINSDTGAVFIQQQYDSIEEAEARLAALKAKVGKSYSLAVSVLDEERKPKAEEKSAPSLPHLRQRHTPRST